MGTACSGAIIFDCALNSNDLFMLNELPENNKFAD